MTTEVSEVVLEQSNIATRGDGKFGSPYWLLCRAASHNFALPVPHVVEAMRKLPIEPLAGAPPIVCGLCVIRGAPTPVVDTAMLFDGERSHGELLITVKTGTRTVAFAADAVTGVKAIDAAELEKLPPLLRDVQTIAAVKTLDRELVFFLETARVLPHEILDRCIDTGAVE